jgi:hypothetical protein
MSDARRHISQGKIHPMRSFSTSLARSCNQLCLLRKNIIPFLDSLDGLMSKINLRKLSINQEIVEATSAVQRHNDRLDFRSRYKHRSLKVVPEKSKNLEDQILK